MTLHLSTLLAIIGMALATYATRVTGLFLMRHVNVKGRTKAAFDAFSLSQPIELLLFKIQNSNYFKCSFEHRTTVVSSHKIKPVPFLIERNVWRIMSLLRHAQYMSQVLDLVSLWIQAPNKTIS